MTQQLTKPPVKEFFERDDVKNKFIEILGNRGNAFASSVLTVINGSDKLKACEPKTLYMCAVMAATLDLPVNANLGFAYIVPYKGSAQFQIGYKGLKQLALRTGQFETIHATDVREGELKERNRLSGVCKFEWIQEDKERNAKKIIGYVAYFKLLNGYSQTLYMTIEEVTAHGMRYSKTFNNGPWKDNFDKMALKTVTKLLLNNDAPMSVEIQMAIKADQAVIKDVDTMDVEYVDEGKAEISAEELTELFNLKADAMTAEQREDITRIISTNEIKSFAKAKEIMMGL